MIGFRLPTRVHIASGAINQLPEVAHHHGLDNVLLVVDPGLADTPWPETVTTALAAAEIGCTVFDDVEVNPRTTTAEKAAAIARQEKVKGVVGLGGGSALDAAKAAAMLATNDGHAEDYEGLAKYTQRPLPMIAVPTTCGTGSEVTWVSVLTHEASKRKISIKGETMFPVQALVDPDLLQTLPADLVKWTALDALTHALEATTCRLANPVSDALAEQAMLLIFRLLLRAVTDIELDVAAREGIMRASTLAGIAFGNADVASVHCLSETLGGLRDMPHGLTNAVLLAPTLAYNRPYIDRRLSQLLTIIDEEMSPTTGGRVSYIHRADWFMESLENFLSSLDVPLFTSLGIPPDLYPTIAEGAARNGSNSSNARRMTKKAYVRLLGKLETFEYHDPYEDEEEDEW